MFDVAVVGLGPAGRTMASACARRGLSVLSIDARPPEAPWLPTYAVWADELGEVPASVIRSHVEAPALRAIGDYRMNRPYVVLDNSAVQATFSLDGGTIRQAQVSDSDLAQLRREARVVIDARGARPDEALRHDAVPAQTAYGIVVDAAEAAPALAGADGVLMDWRPDGICESQTALSPPTFLYAIPLERDHVLLEETCLAAAPGLPIAELKARLTRRLKHLGVKDSAVAKPHAQEVVRIPLRGSGNPPLPGVLAVGTAGRGGHLVTGYSVAHSMATAQHLAQTIAEGGIPKHVDRLTSADLLRKAGLRALLNLDARGTLELFDAFGRLPTPRQSAFLSRSSGTSALAAAMWGIFQRMPPQGRYLLTRATMSPTRTNKSHRH